MSIHEIIIPRFVCRLFGVTESVDSLSTGYLVAKFSEVRYCYAKEQFIQQF